MLSSRRRDAMLCQSFIGSATASCHDYGHDHGSRTHASQVAPLALHFPASISAGVRAAYDFVGCSSPALCSNTPPALCRSSPVGRTCSFAVAASNWLRKWRLHVAPAASTHGHARGHLHCDCQCNFWDPDAHHNVDGRGSIRTDPEPGGPLGSSHRVHPFFVMILSKDCPFSPRLISFRVTTGDSLAV